jgi:hypothetical protein
MQKIEKAADEGKQRLRLGYPARGCPSDSRPLSRSPPGLLLFPHHRATPSADVIENFFIEQHQEKTLSHWHGAFAGRAEELARLQVFEILLSVRRRHQNREPSTLSCVSHHYFAEVLAQQQVKRDLFCRCAAF